MVRWQCPSWYHDIFDMLSSFHIVLQLRLHQKIMGLRLRKTDCLLLKYQCTQFKIHFLLFKVSFQYKALLLRERTVYTRDVFFLRFFGLFRNRFVCFGCFETDPKHRNKPKKCFISFAKQTENQPKQIEFRFVSVRTEHFVCLFRGHPTQYTVMGGGGYMILIRGHIHCNFHFHSKSEIKLQSTMKNMKF
jgi:hypothetical protein